MGIDALLDAAKFVEYQAFIAASARGQQGASSGFPFLMQFVDSAGISTVMMGGVSVANGNIIASNGNNGLQGSFTKTTITINKASKEQEPEPQQVLKKVVRNRAQLQRHCEQVKSQRAYLKDCLESLRSLLPNKDNASQEGFMFEKRRSTSTSAVLKKARREIEELKGQEKEQLDEIEKLKKNSDLLKEKLALMNSNDSSTIIECE